jgi:hypothetical protein
MDPGFISIHPDSFNLGMDIGRVGSPELVPDDRNAFPDMVVLIWVEGLIQKIKVLELAETLCFMQGEYADTGETLIFIELR